MNPTTSAPVVSSLLCPKAPIINANTARPIVIHAKNRLLMAYVYVIAAATYEMPMFNPINILAATFAPDILKIQLFLLKIKMIFVWIFN